MDTKERFHTDAGTVEYTTKRANQNMDLVHYRYAQ